VEVLMANLPELAASNSLNLPQIAAVYHQQYGDSSVAEVTQTQKRRSIALRNQSQLSLSMPPASNANTGSQ